MTKRKMLVIAKPGSRYLSLLDTIASQVDYEVVWSAEDAAAKAVDAEIILTGVGAPAPYAKAAIEKAEKLIWLHSLSAGVDHLSATRLNGSGIPVTNAKGAFSKSLGEYAIAGMLWFAKDLNRMRESQLAGKWDVFDVEMLEGRTLGVLGYGDIGKEAAKRAKAFGMHIIAMRRSAGNGPGDGIADEVWSLDRKLELMSASDYVLLAMPQTPDTVGIVAEAELRAMKQTGIIINLGRGNAIRETALIQALQENWIRGAVLDVFEKEPLPEGHIFYSTKNLLMSAHTADHTSTWQEDSMRIFLENFRRFEAGETLLNPVNLSLGY
ncbi:D-2-hydroxyacid dehydrogenase [Oscillatoria amoena NRMC-F 0135]|nr:D-2-hydroxyacid dehydrogenase [Oscillatoria amoena NRMC-F 0135]